MLNETLLILLFPMTVFVAKKEKQPKGFDYQLFEVFFRKQGIIDPKVQSSISQHLLFKNEIHRQHQEAETNQMVDRERLAFENEDGDDGEDRERNKLLDDLELPKVERTTIVNVADAVGRHHEGIFDQRDAPAEQNHHRQREFAEPCGVLQSQMTVPSKGHEYVRTDQQ